MVELLPEKWMKAVAVTTTVLAVCASIAGSRGSHCVTRNQVLTAQEGSTWAYYQAKSIKQTLLESQRTALGIDSLASSNAQQKGLYERQLAEYDQEISRYEREKAEIQQEAKKIGVENQRVARQGGQFSLAVVFFQIGIMLSSVSALLKRKAMWSGGLIFGAIGLVFLANAVFMFF